MLVGLSFGMLLALAAPGAEDREVIPHRRYRLENGLDVVLHDDEDYPLIAVRVVYHVGSVHDPVDKQGVAHLLEHAMFSGSDHVTGDEMMLHLARAGAHGVNATTRSTSTVYYESVPANQIELVLWLESDRMGFFRVGLARGTIAKERAIVIQEIAQRRRGSDRTIAMTELADLLFPVGHPRRSQDPRSLERITFADVADMQRRHYGPGNATLVLAGALPDDIDALIEEYFGSLRGGERPPKPVIPARAPRPQGTTGTTSAVLEPARFLGWHTSPLYAPGDADADVVARMLGAIASRIGLGASSSVASVDAYQSSGEDGSIFTIRLGGDIGADPESMSAELDAALRRVAAGDFSADDLASAKRRCQLDVYRRLGSIEQRADMMVGYIVAGKPADWVAEDVDRYASTSRESVAAFVREQLLGRKPSMATLLPAGPGAR